MYNLARQVGEANRHAVFACALMAGVEPPVFPDSEPDIPELKARIATAIDFMNSLRPEQINGAADKEVVFTFRNGSQRTFTGRSLLLTFSVPQFFFHVTTAYDILRHCRRRSSARRIFWERRPRHRRTEPATFRR